MRDSHDEIFELAFGGGESCTKKRAYRTFVFDYPQNAIGSPWFKYCLVGLLGPMDKTRDFSFQCENGRNVVRSGVAEGRLLLLRSPARELADFGFLGGEGFASLVDQLIHLPVLAFESLIVLAGFPEIEG